MARHASISCINCWGKRELIHLTMLQVIPVGPGAELGEVVAKTAATSSVVTEWCAAGCPSVDGGGGRSGGGGKKVQ